MDNHHNKAVEMLHIAIKAAHDTGHKNPGYNELVISASMALMNATGISTNNAIRITSLALAEIEAASIPGCYFKPEMSTSFALVVNVDGKELIIPIKQIVDRIKPVTVPIH